jgi:membrane fusion protein, multidrug efflux system
VIAEIEAPDLDQQLLQVRADLASQEASAKLSEATLNRRKTLIASNFVSMQEIDERTADLSNKNAAVKAGQANVERLEALAGYKKITAPFDGVVTSRDTDVGALINAGGNSGPAMFVISDIKKLRVYVNVPQSYVPSIKIGAKAIITVPDYPNRTFPATVEASSQSVDVGSGTTRMQLALDNAAGELMPGGYANVQMSLVREGAPPLHIPASALIFNQNGLRVATVSGDDKVLFKTVTIARDLGRDIELASGLSPDDRVIVAPPDGMADGDQVHVVGSASNTRTKSERVSERPDVKG